MSAAYTVTHRTTYSYDDDVTDSLGVAHVVPRSLPWQSVSGSVVTVTPEPGDQSADIDYYGNTITYFQVSSPHRVLEVTVVSSVTVVPPGYDAEAAAVAWEDCRPLVNPSLPGAWAAVDVTVESPLVAHTPEARAYGELSLVPGRSLFDAAVALMHRIHADFTYDKTATSVTTGVAEIFAAKGGVCQDFAHLMLACLRSNGLAARYVSGYLATTPPPGQERLVGADASHAWVAVWVPGSDSWLMLDPTNDTLVDARYVTVAWGRDYADVPPVKGVIFTEAKKSTLHVSVDVAPAGEAASR